MHRNCEPDISWAIASVTKHLLIIADIAHPIKINKTEGLKKLPSLLIRIYIMYQKI